ncbi:MAG: calcium-binding protein, partial [Pseudomonadota bacterium]
GRGGDAEGDVLLGIEGVLGSAFNDFLVGAADPAGLFGFGGDDTLIGLAGDDTLDGGADNDRLEGRGGADDLIGGDGFDIADYRGSGAAVTLRFDGGSGAGGDAQGDTFAALEGAFGSAFNDFIVGEAGVAMNLQGLAGDDSLIGQDLNDTLLGGDGDDRIEGRAGADVLNGGSGFDIVDYRTSAAGVTVRFDTGTGAGGDAQGDRLTGFEAIFGSGFTDLIIGGQGVDSNLQGLGGADTLIGLDGEDALSGGDGNDRLEGRGGADVLRGGDGFDIADYRTSASGVFVRFDAGTGSGGDAQGDLLFDLEGVFGSAFNDFLIGADGVAVNLQGLDGDDRLIGFDGDDTLLGGDGDDRLEGRGGANVIDGGAGDIDIVDYRTSASAVNVRLDAGRGFAGDALGDQYAGIEIAFGSDMADFIVGAAGVNVNLQGFGGDDTLIGLDGDDVLVGGSGDDRLEGRGGGDIYRGGDGFDIVDYRLSNAGVTARLDIERGIGGDAQGDFLFDLEGVFGSNFADLLIGRAGTDVNLQGLGGSDRLIGIDGDDTLSGGDGNDRLEGRAGDDRLSGGAGFDIFEFAPGFGNDVITDFEDTDFIFLTGFGAAFDTFAEVIAAAVEIDGDTVITFGTDATLTLENTTIAQLEADQFLF